MTIRSTLPLLVLLTAVACGPSEKPQAPVQPAPSSTMPAKAGVPKPSAEAIQQLDAAFDEARGYIEQARAFKSEAEKIERESGRQAANDKLKKASRMYSQAMELVSDVIEPELGPFTEEQYDEYLGQWTMELGKWQKEKAGLGRIHD